jgi:regulator of CtrA degradation
MSATPAHAPLTTRLADALYTEAMLLADETRSYFDGPAVAMRAALDPSGRVAFACESLNATTRLMQVIAWLLARRSGETPIARDLGSSPPIERDALADLAPEARRLIEASVDLHARVQRLAIGMPSNPPASPARSLIERLERTF